MKVYECERCGTTCYPARFLCRNCRHTEFKETEVLSGTVLTYTVIHIPPPGVASPLRIGIVEFEGGVRALGQLWEPTEVGSRIVSEWTVVRKHEGKEYEGPMFHRT